jgi:hypothetical protein
MEGFENIRQISYKKYDTFVRNFSKYKSYNVEIPSVDSATFRLGPCIFNIVPVISVSNGDVTCFDRTHPTKLNFPKIDEITSKMEIPKVIKDPTRDKFSYSLSAIVCDKVNGVAFFSVTKENLWMWFVVLDAVNPAGKNYLKIMDREIVDEEEMEKWYTMMDV